jgi:malate permease and related proteins
VSGLPAIFAADIFPILLIAGVGFLLARKLCAQVKTVTNVAFYALLPCLVFHMLVTSTVSGRQLGMMVLLACLITAAMGVVGAITARLLGLNRAASSAFLLVVMFSNGGNYGLPVVAFAFGSEALAYATVFFLTGAVLVYTLGSFTASAGRKPVGAALKGVLKIPVIYGAAAAIIVVSLGLTVPAPILRPISLLRDAALPLMILILGMQLERAVLPKRLGPVFGAVAVSLLISPMIALGLTSLVGVTGAARQAVVILSSMPVAVTTTILAIEFDVEPDMVTSAVFVSTLLSPFTLAPLIAYLS